MHSCLDQYNANKTAGGNGELEMDLKKAAVITASATSA